MPVVNTASPVATPSAPKLDPLQALSRAEAAAEKKPKPKPNPRQWYVIIDGVAAVALTYKELVVRAGERRIKPKDRIYYAPKDATLHARDIHGLFPDIDAKRPKPPKRFTPSGSLSADAGAAADALASLEQEAEADDEKV